MGGGDAPAPVTNNYQETMREALQAQIDLAPDLFKAESNNNYGRPAYARLMQDLARKVNFGEEYNYDSFGTCGYWIQRFRKILHNRQG